MELISTQLNRQEPCELLDCVKQHEAWLTADLNLKKDVSGCDRLFYPIC